MPKSSQARASQTKYPQIKASLKARLLANRYREGEPIESEAQLALEFGVSRMTARRAVDELEREGYVYRVQGSGSYPTGRRFRQGVFRVRPLAEVAQGLSGEPFTRVLSAGLAVVEPAVAPLLGLEPGAVGLAVARLRGVLAPDGRLEPVLLERRVLRPEQAEELLRHNLAVESIHGLLASLGVEILRVEQSLEAVNLEPAEAGPLGLPAGRAAFLLRRTTFTADGPLGHARYWVRGDGPVFASVFEP